MQTRVLVTHGVHWLPMCDVIVVMTDGRISEMGSYDELLSHGGDFAQFLKTFFTQNPDSDDDDPESKLCSFWMYTDNKLARQSLHVTAVHYKSQDDTKHTRHHHLSHRRPDQQM